MQQPPFTALAAIYDALMADIEYDEWADFVLTYAADMNLAPQTALDLACGTGNFTLQLAQKGLTVTGADRSPEMLAIAQKRSPLLEWHIADLRNFELNQQFDLITCVFDSLNNLLSPEELGAAFHQIARHLKKGGLFACDLNTRLGVQELWEGNVLEGVVQTITGEEVHYHWSHHYQPETELGVVQAFCRVQKEDDFQEFIETHYERGYDPDEVALLLQQAGFDTFEIVEYPDYANPTSRTPRIWVFACK